MCTREVQVAHIHQITARSMRAAAVSHPGCRAFAREESSRLQCLDIAITGDGTNKRCTATPASRETETGWRALSAGRAGTAHGGCTIRPTLGLSCVGYAIVVRRETHTEVTQTLLRRLIFFMRSNRSKRSQNNTKRGEKTKRGQLAQTKRRRLFPFGSIYICRKKSLSELKARSGEPVG